MKVLSGSLKGSMVRVALLRMPASQVQDGKHRAGLISEETPTLTWRKQATTNLGKRLLRDIHALEHMAVSFPACSSPLAGNVH